MLDLEVLFIFFVLFFFGVFFVNLWFLMGQDLYYNLVMLSECKQLSTQQMTAFLATPNMSGCDSATWSSYDEISTPPRTDNDSVRCPFPRYSAYE